MDQKKIGSFIAALRKEKGFTQEQLGEKLNVSQRTVSRWETGRNMPDLSLLSVLCEVLGISLAELMKGERIAEQTITKEDASGILSSVLELVKEKQQVRNVLAALISGIITLICMIALYNYEFSINITTTTDLESAINEYYFSDEVDADILERQAIGNRLIVLYAQNEHPTCGGLAQLEKGIFGKYRMISASNFTWPLYHTKIITVGRKRYLLVCSVNELSDVASYEIDVIKTNGETQTYNGAGQTGSFIHITEIEDGASTAPWASRYFDSDGHEISQESLLAGLEEDTSWVSSGVGSAELWLIYVLEFLIFVLGMIFVRYYLTGGKSDKVSGN